MCKKLSVILSLVLILSVIFPVAIVNGESTIIDKSNLQNGVIRIKYSPDSGAKTKVVITKEDVKYTYNLNNHGVYPLSLGDGDYNVTVWENIDGNSYQLVEDDTVTLDLKDNNKVFLQSIQLINWNNGMEAIKKAASLTKNLKTDNEKAIAIYNYIVKNYKYDYNKISKVSADYITDIPTVYKKSKGICCDFAVIYSAMLRSVGVPAKLVTGYKSDVKTYHAWNQVYIKETNKWITIDTSYDSTKLDKNKKVPMIKRNSDYQIIKVY